MRSLDHIFGEKEFSNGRKKEAVAYYPISKMGGLLWLGAILVGGWQGYQYGMKYAGQQGFDCQDTEKLCREWYGFIFSLIGAGIPMELGIDIRRIPLPLHKLERLLWTHCQNRCGSQGENEALQGTPSRGRASSGLKVIKKSKLKKAMNISSEIISRAMNYAIMIAISLLPSIINFLPLALPDNQKLQNPDFVYQLAVGITVFTLVLQFVHANNSLRQTDERRTLFDEHADFEEKDASHSLTMRGFSCCNQ